VRIAGVECVDNVRGVGDVGRRLPRVLGYGVSLPLDLVIEFLATISGIQDVFNLVFQFIVDNDRMWRRLNTAGNCRCDVRLE